MPALCVESADGIMLLSKQHAHLMSLLALMIQLHIPSCRAENVLPVSLHRFHAGASVCAATMRAGVSVSRNVPRLVHSAAGLSASFHSKEDAKWFIYTYPML